MRAIDTNIVVRLVARDDPRAEAIARALLDQPFLLLPTVVLEAEWVLRSVYRLPRSVILSGFRLLLGHVHGVVPNADAISVALERYEAGADFADMLHLALAAEAEAASFATFDRKLSKQAPDGLPVELLG